VTSPKFKLRWVESQETKDKYKQMLLDEIRLLDDDIANIVEEQTIEATGKENKGFYEFDTDDHSVDSIESDNMAYLSNAKKLECLQKHPKVKRLFLKHNTTIPSLKDCLALVT